MHGEKLSKRGTFVFWGKGGGGAPALMLGELGLKSDSPKNPKFSSDNEQKTDSDPQSSPYLHQKMNTVHKLDAI